MTTRARIAAAAGGDFEAWYRAEIQPRITPAVFDLRYRVEALIMELDRQAAENEGRRRAHAAATLSAPARTGPRPPP